MPRVRKIDRPVGVFVSIPESILAQVKLQLFSEVEGRVPHGKMSELVTDLLVIWLKTERGISNED